MTFPARLLARVTVGATFAAALAFTSSNAAAQDAPMFSGPKYWFEGGVFGGGHFFNKNHGLGRFKEDPTGLSPAPGGVFGARVAINANRWVSLEAEAAATPTLTRDKVSALWVFGFRGSLVVNLLDEGPVRPFVLAGYGTLTSFSEYPDYVPGDTDGAFHAGIGAKVPLTERMGLRIDARILTPPAFASSLGKIGDETSYGGPDFELLAGFHFNFGDGPRMPPKVIIKKEIQIVRLPPVDPDQDGIVGKADKCPEVAEDKDGFEDDDGCPEADNDNDGIPDALDKCPNKAEDKNGIDDEDGCPEVDTDGDGFLGSRDKCPNEPETRNNYQDNDGCPDEIPSEVKKFTGVVEGINFKTKSAVILKGSYVILDKAVKVLTSFPDVRLEISGHTDAKGKADFNRDLSQKRADAVKEYFVKKGIAATRLTSVGYGMDRPIADNKKEAGRSKNRRTEFALIADDAK